MFGVFQDSKNLAIKKFERTKNGSLQLLSVSQTDFSVSYGDPKMAPLITEIVPLNRTDSLLITIEKKRYLIYNYLTGEVVKEILPIRGSYFRACSDY